jgi:RecB family exonuclease
VLPERAHEVVPAATGRAVWAVDGSLLPPRSEESASSLESLLGCPLRWALTYRADLRAEGVAELPAGNLLFGTLAHQLLGAFLVEHRDALPEPAAARAMLLERFDEAVEAEASALLQPGQVETMQRVRFLIARAGETLVAAIRGGGFRVEGCEVEVSDRRFADAGLAGFIDLLLSHPEHGQVVVDLKWGGWSFCRDLLLNGRALQIALYAHAVRRGKRRLPPTAYFILSEARFLTLHRGLFEPAVVVEGPSMEETLAAAEAVYGEARVELGAGELVAPPLLDEESPQAVRREDYPLQVEAPCTFCDFGGICGVGLEGPS